MTDDRTLGTRLILALLESGGSDLHLCEGKVPRMRVGGELAELEGVEALDLAQIGEIAQDWIDEFRVEQLMTKSTRHVDFHHTHDTDDGEKRFRGHAYMTRGNLAIVLRWLSDKLPALKAVGATRELLEILGMASGLLIVSGPTGSGKSTTLARFIDYINSNRALHILTVEQPIEYVHQDKRCQVSQREVGVHGDVETFAEGLRDAMREDPDVIMIGEMRDRESMEAAVYAAETGHLVLSTMHNTSVSKVCERIINNFPPEQQAAIRTQLIQQLRGVVCQQLLRGVDGKIVIAREVMLQNPAIGHLLREGKTHMIPDQLSRSQGMVQLDEHLGALVATGKVSEEVATYKANDPKRLPERIAAAKRMIERKRQQK